MLILLRPPFTERWEPSTGRRCVGDFGEGYKLQAVQFLKLRWSLIYDLIEGSWTVGHSFMKSSEVTVMQSLSASRIERRCYACSFAVTNHRTLSAGHWSKTVQKTVQDMLDVSQTTYVLVEHLRSWSWGKDLWTVSQKDHDDDLDECLSYQLFKFWNTFNHWCFMLREQSVSLYYIPEDMHLS